MMKVASFWWLLLFVVVATSGGSSWSSTGTDTNSASAVSAIGACGIQLENGIREKQRGLGASNIDGNVMNQERTANNEADEIIFEEDADESDALSPLLRIFPCGCVLLTDTSPTSRAANPIRTYVDTGASVTAMSEEAALKCGLTHLLDKRYHGKATGIGNCRVVGRIPANSLVLRVRATVDTDNDDNRTDECPWIHLPCPEIAVLERLGGSGSSNNNNNNGGNKNIGGVELLLGLDTLRAWKARICLDTIVEHMTVQIDVASPSHSSWTSSLSPQRTWLGRKRVSPDATMVEENTIRNTATIAFANMNKRKATPIDLVFWRGRNSRQGMKATDKLKKEEVLATASQNKTKDQTEGCFEEEQYKEDETNDDVDLSGF